jgi:hypothetical protein
MRIRRAEPHPADRTKKYLNGLPRISEKEIALAKWQLRLVLESILEYRIKCIGCGKFFEERDIKKMFGSEGICNGCWNFDEDLELEG